MSLNTNYNKAVVSIVGAVVTTMVALGVIPVDGSEAMATAVSTGITSVLVYLIPNKPA